MQETLEEVAHPLHFREFGEGGVRILFVHGWMVSGRVWDRLLPLLPDFRAIVPDLRGSGASNTAGGSASLDDYVADLAALCESLDLRDVHLVGHSMGGQIATLLAVRQPARFRTLTLLNPVPVHGMALPEELLPLFRNSGGNRESFGRILDMACLRLPADARSGLLEDALKISPALISAGFDAWRLGCNDAALDAAAMPVTVFATDDPFLSPAFLEQEVVARLSDARLEYLPGAGHYPQLEMPADIAARLRNVFG